MLCFTRGISGKALCSPCESVCRPGRLDLKANAKRQYARHGWVLNNKGSVFYS